MLFIAGLEVFLRENGCVGVGINGKSDIILVMYAHDLVILAYSLVDLKKNIKLLEQCQTNVLKVNVSKAKVILLHKARNIRRARKLTFRYGQDGFEMVGEVEYFGVDFKSSTRGLSAIYKAIQDARILPGGIYTAGEKNSDDWQEKTKLF